MRKRLSFTRLLYNDKVMLIVSFLLATAIWAAVISGPANIEERQISMTVTVDLTNSYAYQSGLRVVGQNEFDVKVTVSGKWSVIAKLTEEDLRVRPDLNAITAPGDVELPLAVSRNSVETDYDILSVTPTSLTVTCDYWKDNVSCPVTVDVSSLSTKTEGDMIGEPILDQNIFPGNKASVSGPEALVEQIDSLVARVEAAEALTSMKQYQTPLVALDKNGNELDLSRCKIANLVSNTVTVTVPIWEERVVQLGYTVVNRPTGFSDDILSIEPKSVDLLGPAEELDVLEQRLANLGTVDFAKLAVSNPSVRFQLDIPETVQAIDAPKEAIVSLNTDNLLQKTLSLNVTQENTVVKGDLNGLSVSVREQTLNDIVVVGDAAAVSAISAAALSVEVDAQSNLTAGTKQYAAQIKVNGYDDVWVFYGRTDNYVNVFITLEEQG